MDAHDVRNVRIGLGEIDDEIEELLQAVAAAALFTGHSNGAEPMLPEQRDGTVRTFRPSCGTSRHGIRTDFLDHRGQLGRSGRRRANRLGRRAFGNNGCHDVLLS